MTTTFDKSERGKRVRLIRNMIDLTIDEFANKIGVSNRAVKYWENGKGGGLSEKGAEKIVSSCNKIGLQCNVIWLLHGTETQPILTDNSHSASFLLTNHLSNAYDNLIKKEIQYFHTNNSNAITMSITDNSMEPFYSIGDIVGGKRKYNKDLGKAVHQNCIIETKKQQILCRRLLPGTQPDLFNLCCINQRTSEPFVSIDIEIISAAPIIWLRRQEN